MAPPPAPPGRGMIPLHPHPRFRAGESLPGNGAEATGKPRPPGQPGKAGSGHPEERADADWGKRGQGTWPDSEKRQEANQARKPEDSITGAIFAWPGTCPPPFPRPTPCPAISGMDGDLSGPEKGKRAEKPSGTLPRQRTCQGPGEALPPRRGDGAAPHDPPLLPEDCGKGFPGRGRLFRAGVGLCGKAVRNFATSKDLSGARGGTCLPGGAMGQRPMTLPCCRGGWGQGPVTQRSMSCRSRTVGARVSAPAETSSSREP